MAKLGAGAKAGGLAHAHGHELRAPQSNDEVAVVPELRRRALVDETLDNGLRVVIVAHGRHPTVHARLSMPGGQAAGTTAATALLARVFYERNRSHRGSLSGEYGGRSGFLNGPDAHHYLASSAAGNVGNLIAIAAETVRFPALYRDAAGNFRRSDRVARLLKQFDKPETRAEASAQRGLFGEHPYGRSVNATNLSEFKTSELSRWQKQVFQPKGTTLTIVGAINPEEVLGYVKEHFGPWRGTPNITPWTAPRIPEVHADRTKIPRVTAHQPARKQDKISLTCRMPNHRLEQHAAARVLAASLEDRLGRTLRQAWGSSYGVHARSSALAGGVSVLELGFAVDSERYTEALDAAESLFSSDAELGDADQLQWARWRAATQLRHSLRASPGVTKLVADLLGLGYRPQSFRQLPATTLNVSDEVLEELFQHCKDSVLMKIVGPDGH